jgi:hypothetical protein
MVLVVGGAGLVRFNFGQTVALFFVVVVSLPTFWWWLEVLTWWWVIGVEVVVVGGGDEMVLWLEVGISQASLRGLKA